MKTSMFFAATLVALAGFSATAQSLKPKVVIPVPGKSTIISKMSDNGLWGVAETASTTDGDLRPKGGTLFNLETLQTTSITDRSGLAGVADVTDDGSRVAGECQGKPAYWNASDKSWTILPMPEGFAGGRLNAITPDGKYAAGYLVAAYDEFNAFPAFYDLTTNQFVELPNLPVYDMTHQDMDQCVFYSMSADGRYLLGYMSMSYLLPAGLCVYVYDREDNTYDFIGFTPDDVEDWTPDVPNTLWIGDPFMSNNGLWVTGTAYMVTEVAGSQFPIEERRPFRYDVKNKKIEIYNDTEAANSVGFAIDNDGFMYAASPATNPYATAMFRAGNYMVSLEQILRQVYGMDFLKETTFQNTGKTLSVSNDGLKLLMLPTTEDTYIMELPEPISQLAGRVKLLADYTIDPLPGVEMSKLQQFTITFTRDVAVKGNSNKITFASEDGKTTYNPVGSNGFVADGKKVTVTFRSRDLEPGMKYTLTIPEGMIVLRDDNSISADEISLSYNGRANTPVQLLEAYPDNDDAVPYLDLNGNPIILNFDTDIKVAENAKAFLYNSELETPITELGIIAGGKQAVVYPPVRQNLFSGSEFDVVILEGALTDISGGGASKQINLHYIGTYERPLSDDDKYLFNEDCGNTENFLFYEGDHREPDFLMAQWKFTKDTTPWNYVCDDDSADMAFGSHSMYNPAGQADDWMMTSQIHIPDANCYLQFDAQSYLEGYRDVLKVYVFEADEVYNTLTKEIVERIRKEGKVVFEEVLDPGRSENTLDGDWENYVVNLPEYSGKSIYIAFVNENDDQSAIFVDNIRVVHDSAFFTNIETADRVVNQENVTIKGSVTVGSEISKYDTARLVLLDAEENEIDRIEQSGLDLSIENPVFRFSFDKPLPLRKAEVNKYFIDITLDNEKVRIAGDVRNLTFQPLRKVVLEEFNGSECSNCPLGIRAIENIQQLYPNTLIPICVRTYSNDVLGAGMANYSSFLGMSAAPSGRINRGVISMPMMSADMDYMFSGSGYVDSSTGLEPKLWLDLFRDEITAPAELGLEVSSSLDEANNKIDVKATVSSALNLDRTAYNIFAVVIENKLETYQLNGFSSVTDPDLGDWGYGGKFGQSVVYPYEANDVARTTWGTTFNGTGGLIPATLKAGEFYTANFSVNLPETIKNLDNCDVIVMLIDAGKEKVVNANICALNGTSDINGSGVEEIVMPGGNAIGVTVAGDNLMVNGEDFAVEAYDLAGMRLLSAKGTGLHAYSLNGYKGVIIVKTTDADGNAASRKFIVK
ncbi:MAG: Omp28-related outer membrane protein [Muribaculaceae bacterium]|nr:Omp28-related outer membrane protein [Muribaculaceae bacterium]